MHTNLSVKTDLAETLRLVVSEFDRLTELQQTDWKSAASQMEFSEGLPSEHVEFPARAERYYRCGKVAQRNLYECVFERAEKDHDVREKISAQTIFHALQVEVAQNCIEQRKTIAPELAQKLFSEAKKLGLTRAVDRNYFFPVFAIRMADRDEFSIAAASFVRTKAFFERSKEEWQHSIATDIAEIGNESGSDHIKKNIEWLYDSAERYYRQFPCIASVRINGAEPELGQLAAKRILESSFNILRIFVPSRRGQFIGLAEQSPIASNKSFIEQKATGGFITWNRGRQGEPVASEDSISRMRQRMPQSAFIEAVIEKQRNWKILTPLEKRFMNGLAWYGDGWKEQVSAARLVKFAVALETLLMTGAKEAITETLAERVALLCGADMPEREQLYSETRRVYSARSKAVHGAVRQESFDLGEINVIAEKLCTFALFQCASLFPILIDGRNETEGLTEFFKLAKLGSLEEAAARMGAKISAAPTDIQHDLTEASITCE
jgi:hypothetical protein